MNDRQITTVFNIVVVGLVVVVLTLVLLRTVDLGIIGFALGVIGILLFIHPYVGLVVYIVFLYVRPMFMIPALAPEHVPLMMFIGLGTLGSLVLRNAFENKPVRLFSNPLDWLVWWFFASVLLSNLTHGDISGALESVRHLAGIMIIYFVITNLLNNRRRLDVFGRAVAICTVYMAVEGIYQDFTGVGFFGQELLKGRIVREGAFGDPNALGMAFLMGLPFVLSEAVRPRSRMIKLSAALGVLAVVWAMYLTNSRGTMVGFVATLVVFMMWRAGCVKGLLAGAGLGAIIFGFVYFFGPSRMADLSPDEPSAYGRVVLWNHALYLFGKNPLFGIGYGHWPGIDKIAHNSFLSCAGQLGLFGLVGWVTLLYLAVKYTRHVATNSNGTMVENPRWNGAMVMWALVGFIFTMVFITKTYNPVFYIFVAFASAVTNVFVEQSGDTYVLFEKKDALTGLLLSLVGLAIFKVFVMFTM